MALADILVHVDTTPHCAARLDLAISLATRHGARLTGLYVMAPQYYQPRHGSAETAAAEARDLFSGKIEKAGCETEWLCVDWSVIGVSVTEVINHHAHYTDLVIVGQTAPGEGPPADLPERVVMGAGRPVLIVPYAGTFRTAGERILVAWKAGRESTRAVNDALPFLKRAGQVNLLAINSSTSYEDDDESLCSDICAHLARHGVTAVSEGLLVADLTIGDTLLNRAFEQGFDLLVMGAFAHTPQGKLTLGAVARQMLGQMTVPVLMSH